MDNKESQRWVKLSNSKEKIQHMHNRSWQDAFEEILRLTNTFLVLNEETLGNYYESMCRACMGMNRFITEYPKYYSGFDVQLRDSNGTVSSLRDRVANVWMLPQHSLDRQRILQDLDEKRTINEVLEHFLENCPMMGTLLKARTSREARIVPARDMEMHLHLDNLFAFLLMLLENVAQVNAAIMNTKQGENDEFYQLSEQIGSETYIDAWPDIDDPKDVPYFTELATLSNVIVKEDVKSIGNNIFGTTGYQAIRGELDRGGSSTLKFRTRLTKIFVLDNVFPELTNDFLTYYNKQIGANRRWDSWFRQTSIHNRFFSEGIAERELTETNHELVYAILEQIPVLLDPIQDEDEDVPLNQAGGEYRHVRDDLDSWAGDFISNIGIAPYISDDMSDGQAIVLALTIISTLSFGVYYVVSR